MAQSRQATRQRASRGRQKSEPGERDVHGERHGQLSRGRHGGFLFVADDGVHGRQFWRTDGTAAGTKRLTDAKERLLTSRFAYQLGAFAGSKFFFGVEGPGGEPSLWVSDPPPSSHLLTVVHPEGPSSRPVDFLAFGDRLLFSVITGDNDTAAGWRASPTPRPSEPSKTRLIARRTFSGTSLYRDGRRMARRPPWRER